MGIIIDLNKVNYEKFIEELMKDEKINDRVLLEKILLEFGNHIGDDLIILHNEYYEDGICTWNMFHVIEEVFKLDDDEYVSDVYYDLEQSLISYKEIDEAYENLGLERRIPEE